VNAYARDLRLRPPCEGDSRLIWTWRNDPVSRDNFRNEDPISWQAHEAWFHAALADPNKIIFIGQIDNIPIGIIRFDLIDGPVFDVSINLAPERRGKGVGAQLLAAACETIEREGRAVPLQAVVRLGNIASRRVFQQCGFVEREIDGAFVSYWRDVVGRNQEF
jgi:UDP-2,4-diacetamido-2,4,6-trideoxy-beta-L-altropyranose hydrolase